jgi:hypothetical protein
MSELKAALSRKATNRNQNGSVRVDVLKNEQARLVSSAGPVVPVQETEQSCEGKL